MKTDHPNAENVLPFRQRIMHDFSPDIAWSSDLIIAIVLEGGLSIHYKNHTRDFALHDVFFFPPFETFSIVSSLPHTRVLALEVDSGYLHAMCPQVEHLSMQKDHISHDMGNPVYCRICTDFADVIFGNMKNEICTRIRSLEAVLDMVTVIFDTYGRLGETPETSAQSRDRSLSIMVYINEHFTEKITVSEIARFLGIHPQYFSAVFNKQFHDGFSNYLNNYRVNHSLGELIGSSRSILDIAIENGFSNHKTYASAFRRYFGCSPMEYRKKYSLLSDRNAAFSYPEISDDAYGVFSYFRQFIQNDNSASSGKHLKYMQALELKPAELLPGSFTVSSDRFISVGRAASCLRSDMQRHILLAKKECGINYLRIRDIFSDELYIYYENEKKEPSFSWQALDSVFDFIISSGLHPFPEIGYMPEKLASKKQYAGWQYRPNVSIPRSMTIWKSMIRNFLTHYISKYGLEEVRSWHFDFWTSPDLKIRNPYWNESMESFFDFYRCTYAVFQEVDSGLQLGTPNFSDMTGFPWYEKFFQFCYANQLYPAYVSVHLYGCELLGKAEESDTFSEINSESYSISNQHYILENLQKLQQIMNRCGFRSMDIIISDCNLTFLPKDLVRDTCYMGPFLCRTYADIMKQVRGFSYWTLSDIHEDAFPESTLFRGGPGMLDYRGLRKASFNTLSLINRLGCKILKSGENFIFVQKGAVYQLLLYNLARFDVLYSTIEKSAVDDTHRYNIYSNSDSLSLNIAIAVPEGNYYIRKYEVNREYGSAYDMWGQIGFPSALSQDTAEFIREYSVPRITMSVQKVDQMLLLDEEVPAHGVMLLEIQPQGT